MAAKPPDAFLSYTRFDDQHDGGAISEFRRRLADSVRAVTGETFEIFQDVDGIGLGEHWPGKLDQMLDETRFFIPILTPSFFRSEACRDELEKFLQAERDRGRYDIVLPIYYIRCRLPEDPSQRASDPLASAIHERQREDWRERRWKPFEDPEVRRSLEALADKIDDARRRAGEEARERAEARQQAEEAARRRAEAAGAKPRTEPGRRGPAPRGLEPGTAFRDIDAPWCPELVIIPPGKFMMGSPDDDSEGDDDEKPQHLVRIAYPLAVGRYPVTFEEYDHFVAATRGEQPGDEGWGRGRRPVINVSWEDARAYVAWLAAETSQPYRLLSEAEWEYACRAGTTTRYWWGDEMMDKNANYGGKVARPARSGIVPRIPLVFTTCTATSGNGSKTAGTTAIGGAGRRQCVDERRLQPAGAARGLLGRLSGVSPLCLPRLGRARRPERRRRLPGGQDAYPLNLHLFTPWGLGEAPVDFSGSLRVD